MDVDGPDDYPATLGGFPSYYLWVVGQRFAWQVSETCPLIDTARDLEVPRHPQSAASIPCPGFYELKCYPLGLK
jgi:hypothetical protein